jgi:LPP20 lipoprotein
MERKRIMGRNPLRSVFLIGFILTLAAMLAGCQSAPGVFAKSKDSEPDHAAAANQAFRELEHPEQKSPGPTAEAAGTSPHPTSDSSTGRDLQVVVATGQRADWVDGSSPKYPSARYLTGVGMAAERQQAEDNARAEIAKVFYSHIDASTKVYQEYLQTVSGATTRESGRTSVQDILNVSTHKVLSGVRIAEVYREPKPPNAFYALAVLDREQSMVILREKINALDKDIQTQLARAGQQSDQLFKVKELKTALETHLLRQAHDAELVIVNPSGQGISPAVAFVDIKNRLTDILARQFRIRLAVKGDRAQDLQEAMADALTQEGFSLAGTNEKANVLVKGSVEIKPLEQTADQWKYVRWKTAFDLVDLKGNSVFGSISDAGREGHLSLPQAQDRAVLKIKKDLLPKVSREIARYIFSPPAVQ